MLGLLYICLMFNERRVYVHNRYYLRNIKEAG